jgi:hypothetical protein
MKEGKFMFRNQVTASLQHPCKIAIIKIVMEIKKSLIVAFVSLTTLSVMSLSSCSSGKMYSREGTIEKIEYGKDGYTASLKDKKGEDFDAVISRVRMEKTYKVLKSGDKVELSGDTIHLDNKVRILVKNIK